MYKILFLVMLITNLFSYEGIKGKTVLLKFNQSAQNSYLIVKNQKIPILRNPKYKDKYFALIPIAYKEKKDKLKLLYVKGKIVDELVLHVKNGKYKKETLNVSSKKVNPPKKELNRIYSEYKEANMIYNTQTPKMYWSKPFLYPLDSKITSLYGNARIFNGSLKSYHSGTDFRAKVGTHIKAVNDGVVVIARKRYYAGGSVVIDHGFGIYSAYYHLSVIKVKVGDKIKQAQVIGLSGKSGRVTGPHLHFSLMLQGYKVDPLDFIKKANSLFKN